MFPAQTVLGNQSHATSVYVADIDNDTYKDVVAASQLDNTIAWYHNNGNGTFGPKQVISTLAGGAIYVSGADLNGDGLIDVVSTSNDRKVAWYRHSVNLITGEHTFGPQQVLSATYQFPRTVDIADLNGDGRPDILVASLYGNTIFWIPNLANDASGNAVFGTTEQVIATSVNEGPMMAVLE